MAISTLTQIDRKLMILIFLTFDVISDGVKSILRSDIAYDEW